MIWLVSQLAFLHLKESMYLLISGQAGADHAGPSKGFTVLGVSLDANAEKWKRAVEEDIVARNLRGAALENKLKELLGNN
jgi:hypothetical protein